MRPVLIAIALSISLLGCAVADPPRQQSGETCFIGGCSHEVCSDRPGVFTPCLWYAVYACYQDARCERQLDGACGWTPTPELTSCLASYPPPGSQP